MSGLLLQSGGSVLLQSGGSLLLQSPPSGLPFGWLPMFGPAASAVILPATLPGAIVARFDASSSMAWVEGGITYGVAPNSATDSDHYCEFWLVSEAYDRTTSGGYVKRQVYQFNCYSSTSSAQHDNERMADGLVALFNPTALAASPLAFQDGKAFVALPGTGSIDESEVVDGQGRQFRRKHFDVLFRSNRTYG